MGWSWPGAPSPACLPRTSVSLPQGCINIRVIINQRLLVTLG